MFRLKRRTVVVTAAVAAVLLGAALAVTFATGSSGAQPGVTYLDGNPAQREYAAGHRPLAPDFAGTTLTGSKVTLAGYRGKAVVLNFWGSWCPPCRDEAATLQALQEKYGPQGVAFLGDDVNDTPVNALAFTRGHGVTYPSISDPGYAVVQDFAQVVPVKDTPTTVVIDKTGHIAGVVLGQVSYGTMTTLLKDAAVTS